jgi:hypothetical protein
MSTSDLFLGFLFKNSEEANSIVLINPSGYEAFSSLSTEKTI